MKKYVGDTCTGCKTYKKYVHLIEVQKERYPTICQACKSVVPSHIPKGQHKRYLDRIFRKELAEL
jgi:hypothetical protein